MSFVESSQNYKLFILQNILLLKMLHDRGYPTNGYDELGLFDILGYFFKGTTMEKADIVMPDILIDPEEDSEEEYLAYCFEQRPQFLTTIPLPFHCSAGEETELLEILDKAVLEGEDAAIMNDMFFMEASIQEGKKVVIRVVDYHPETNTDDYYVCIMFTFRVVIEFCDKVAEIAERRKLNGRRVCQAAS